MVVTTAYNTGPWSLSGKTPTRNRQVCSLFADLQEDAVTVFFTINKIRSWKNKFCRHEEESVSAFVHVSLYSCSFIQVVTLKRKLL